MKEYKVVDVKAMTKETIKEKAESTMNKMATEGWKVVTMTQFSAVEIEYSLLIVFERGS